MVNNLTKQFLHLKDKPVLYYSVKAFLDAYDDLQIILVLPIAFTDIGQEIIDAYFENERILLTNGGDTRYDSVKNGLNLVKDESIIFVHDAVRCLVSVDLIHRCYEVAMRIGSAVPTVPFKDSVRVIKGDGSEAIDRSRLAIIQTPQTFYSKML